MDNQVSNRLYWLDLLRVVATIAVIFLHVSGMAVYKSQMDYEWYVSIIADSVVRWAVPVFVMISGALFLSPKKEIDTPNLYRKYIKRLLITYIFWWAIYSMARMLNDTIIEGGYTFRMGYLTPHFHLWFLPMLAVVYALIPILRKIASDERIMTYALVIWACYIGASFIMIKDIPQISSLFVMNNVVGYAGYFLLGFWLSVKFFSQKVRKVLYGLGLLGGAVTITGSLVVSNLAGGGTFIPSKYQHSRSNNGCRHIPVFFKCRQKFR